MKAIAIYDVSAIECLDLGLCKRAEYVERLDTAELAGAAEELHELAGVLPQLSTPIHILVSGKGSRRNSSQWKCHVSVRPFPRNSFLKVSENVYVAAPHLCFVHFARRLSMAHAMLLGMELCGRYSTLRLHGAAGRIDSDKGYYERDPLTSASTLWRYVLAFGCGSKSSAFKACKILQGGARSPAEAQLNGLLGFAALQGGYARGGFALNQRISLSPDLAMLAGVESYECDFLWKLEDAHVKVDLEYDGEMAHSGESKRSYDNIRRTVLGKLGIRVITLDKRQLYDQAVFESVVGILSEHLGRPLAVPSQTVRAKRLELRAELLQPHPDLYPSR